MNLVLLNAAEVEMIDAAERYEMQAPGLGDQFLDETLATIRLLSKQRFLGRPVRVKSSTSVREYVMHRFPYTLDSTTLTVVAISHQHRRRGYWLNRIQEPVPMYTFS